MPFSQTVHITVEPRSQVTLKLNYQEKSQPRDILYDRIEITITDQSWSRTLRWDLNTENGALAFISTNLISDPKVLCVAKCLGIAISKIVAECVWSHWGDAGAIMECIKSKAAGALADGAICITECFVAHP